MRHLAALLLLAVSAVPALAQWQVFAEKLPKPGTWATYRMETTKAGQPILIFSLFILLFFGL